MSKMLAAALAGGITLGALSPTHAQGFIPEPTLNGITLVKTTWRLSGFGTVAEAEFTVRSSNDHATNDISFECVTAGKSGTRLSKVRATVYDTVSAKGVKVFRNVNMGFVDSQSATLACKITGTKP